MNTLFRARVPKKLLQETEEVAIELGTTTQEIVRMTFAAVVAHRALPFRPGASEDDGLAPAAYRARVLDSFYDDNDANSEER